ncbi:hypothetical protein ABPG72_019141 [Tetrahymena utriculariae]
MYKLLLAFLFCLSFAASLGLQCEDFERQAKGCPKIYRPVCAIQKQTGNFSQVKQGFANKCEACSQSETQFVIPGNCEDYPKAAVFCNPAQKKNHGCIEIYQAVCGVMFSNENFMCDSKYCAQTYENYCYACQDSAVGYYIQGECQEIDFEDNENY